MNRLLRLPSLAMSKMHLVVGSDTGVVNIYDNPLENHRVKETNEGMENSWNGMQQVARRKRICMINSLTTEVDNMAFSGNGEILAVSSRFKRDSLRLIHTPTYRVFANFPSSKSPLKLCLDGMF